MVTALVVGVILPVSIAFFVDLGLGTLPVATLVALIIFMPLGGVWLSWTALREFDQVIQEVAPADPDPDFEDGSSEDDQCG
jgi:hypothetical protein